MSTLPQKIFTSKNVIIFSSLFILLTHLYVKEYKFEHWNNTFGWDVLAYYIYLPFGFIFNDPGISNTETINLLFEKYNFSGTFYQAFELDNGNRSPMYSIGMAILYLPFFLMGHIWALLSTHEADGFSFPYRFMVDNGILVYIILGFFYSRRILLRLFNETTTTITLLCMILGTSLFQESIVNGLAPHAVMFAGMSCCLFLFLKWLDSPTFKNSFILGVATGLCILVRGSDATLIFIFLFWGIHNKETLMKRIFLLQTHWRSMVIAFIGLFLFPIIQMIYWKIFTGQFIFNPYQVTPGFDWLEPHFIKVFFSYRKGWLLYTPMILFVFIGIVLLWKKNKEIAWSITLFFVFNVYMISSWGTWWQGGSFGSRYFVESYAILIIPLAVTINTILEAKTLKFIFLPVLSLVVALNLFQTWQFNNWILLGDSMTKDYYWKVFLKTSVTAEDKKLLGVKRTYTPVDHFMDIENYTHKTLAHQNYDDINTFDFSPSNIDSSHSRSGNYSYKITPESTYGPTFRIHWEDMTQKEHVWLKVSCWVYSDVDYEISKPTFTALLNHNNNQYIEKSRGFELEKYNLKSKQWQQFSFDYLTPYPLSLKNDVINVFPYIRGTGAFYIDDFHIEMYERKW